MVAISDPLRRCVWAAELPDEDFARVRRSIVERKYAKGAYVCHRGDRLDFWTGVVDGLVKMSAIAASGKAMTFAGIGRGSWFGEGSLLKDEARKYDIVALRDTRLALMPKASFNWLAQNSVAFNRFLVRQLNERMGLFIATVEQDRIHDPVARVARNIAWLLNPVLYPDAGKSIAINQEELGLVAGLSRASVNKALQDLESEGLIRVGPGTIEAVDVARLAAYERGQE
ncbi:MAG: Crp/Fnr family transcriptional regulator [Phyllobacteriaceae bacterium]|nr:Crp/Fnr family transcriptional regulator [Phyllobacteriaceae bacterium]